MNNALKTLLAVTACVVLASNALAFYVEVNQTSLNLGYMNVYETPANGGGFLWGSSWGFADLTAVYDGSDLTLGPNCIGDPDPYWYVDGGAPGHPGNKVLYADSYAQVDDGTMAGEAVHFSGVVLLNTLTAAHVAKAFLRDFAPDFSSFNETIIDLPASGEFTLSINTVNDPARHVQWGFELRGPCVWVTDLAPFGSITIGRLTPVATETSSFGNVKALFR
jgi:hypothetical protein